MAVRLFKLNLILLFTPVVISAFLLKTIQIARAEKNPKEPLALAEDDLETRDGVRWGGAKWPFSKIVEVQDGLVGSPVGRVIIDRHGIDKSDGSILFKTPFSNPEPGKSVFISLWGSKIEGCYAELLVQVAPKQPIQPEVILATNLQLGVNGQIVQLEPQQNSPKVGSFDYTYVNNETQYSAVWYMSRQIFPVDATTANLLSNASAETIKARVNFGQHSVIIPIGENTVQGWKQAYQFNPACQDPSGQNIPEETESPF